ncbi:hypothetical protein BRADI_3g00885v3 [Brachypodium distachyon]|uniref:Uncharacterized protein n=1 Tax=Brachypodium distachyon TaxID=15368 RepID=A0A0Q3J397_BRADI|nr:hypothetical protein BRADI_3g00885v3 [Brachypodium distachyon]
MMMKWKEGWSSTHVALAMLSHIPPACRRPMMKMLGLVGSDGWVAFASSVPGLVVSALSVGHDALPSPRRGPAMWCVCFIGRRLVVGDSFASSVLGRCRG